MAQRIKPQLTAAEAMALAERMGRMRPERIRLDPSLEAAEGHSFNAIPLPKGMVLRINVGPENMDLDLAMNAVVATQLAEIIAQMGDACAWRNTDDGSLIVKDPENLSGAGPRS